MPWPPSFAHSGDTFPRDGGPLGCLRMRELSANPRIGSRIARHVRTEPAVSAESNIETIKAVYAAFNKGDLARILDVLSDDVDWATEATSTAAPWYGARHGKQQVADFFSAFTGTMATDEFTLLAYAAYGDDVMTVVHHRSHNKDTGHSVDMNQHHWFGFSNGKIAYHRASEDTAQVEASLRN